ncbi:MAG: hypothetical protein FWH24_01110 [Oscillospiraceae bacterium]|nr:hypothetical protein [Oscillospiraceae bacterium]
MSFKLKKINVEAMLLILQPVFFLLTLYNGLKNEDIGNIPGVILAGLIFGVMFFKTVSVLNPDFRSAEGIIFLLGPFFLFLLTFIESDLIGINFNSNFFWIVFFAVYLLSGAVLFIKNNKNKLNKTELYAVSLCAPFLIFSLLVNFVANGIAYSPDSYGYFDMSKFIFNDFGLVSVTWQYMEFTDYGISFPYLFPALIAVFNFFTGFGMFSGTVINIIAVLFSFYYILKISFRLAQSAIPGLMVSALLFFSPEYLGEVFNARAVPLSLLCVLLILNIISRSEFLNKKTLFFIGLFSGAGMVIRFDFFVVPALMGVIFIFLLKKNVFKLLPFYIFGILVFTAPWIIYSLVHFGTLWISDNSGTLFLVTPQIPQRFFIPDEIVPTLFNDPAAWFLSRQNIIMRGFAGFLSMLTRPFEFFMLLIAAAAGILSKGAAREIPVKNFKMITIFTVLIYSAKTLAVILVGYGDLRYHAETLAIVSLVLLCAGYTAFKNRKVWIYFTALLFSVLVMTNLQPALMRNNIEPKLLEAFINTAAVTPDFETLEIERILTEDSGAENARDIRLFYIGGRIFRDPYVLGAYTDLKSYARISNIDEDRLLYLMKNYIKPDYIYASENEQQWVDILRENYFITLISETPPLYGIKELKQLGENGIRANSLSNSDWNNGIGILYPSVIIFRNTETNRKKLENARRFETGGFYADITYLDFDDYWIYAEFARNTELEPFAYPNEITIIY